MAAFSTMNGVNDIVGYIANQREVDRGTFEI
jgi:hypothetical protein